MLAHEAERRRGIEGRRRLDHVLAVAPNAILVIERDGRCAYINAAAARAVGIDAAVVEGRSLFDPGLPPQLRTVIARVGATRATPARGELELATPEGAHRFEYLLTSLGDDGTVVVSLRDLTPGGAATRPATHAGGGAAAAAGGAAAAPAGGSAELAERLRQSCHDLRTRLTVILNWGLILGRQELHEGLAQQGATAVVASARRMGELIDELALIADQQAPLAGPSGNGGP
jgi:PAS domain S-box-containing protein